MMRNNYRSFPYWGIVVVAYSLSFFRGKKQGLNDELDICIHSTREL